MVDSTMQRRLAAILAIDVVGYARHVRANEDKALRDLKDLQTLEVQPRIVANHGRIFKLMGDGILAEFVSALEAVNAAAEIQTASFSRNRDLPQDQKLELRAGINLGDVVIDGEDLQGDGVNLAARLEAIADPGSVCISNAVYEQVRDRCSLQFTDMGKCELKNIDRPVRVWRWNASEPPKPQAQRTRSLPLPTIPSIVVLPFDDLSVTAGQDHITDGFVEAITATLSRIKSFFVIARNSAFTYKGRAVNVVDVGRELGVAYVLEGSVQRAGSRLRIIVQLVETANGAHVWADRYDGTMDAVFDLQDHITEKIAGAIQPSIRIAEVERSRRKRPQDLGAYDFTMRAFPHVWALEKEQSTLALELLDKALALDPDYPLAISLAAWCHAQRSVYNWSDDIIDSQSQSLRLAERSADLSNEDPLILTVLGAVHTFLRQYGTAHAQLERALAIDPNSAWTHSRLGWLDNYLDQPKSALDHFERALRLSPLDPMNFNNYAGMGSAFHILKQYSQAVDFYRRALEERPHAYWIYRQLAPALISADKMVEAKAACVQLTAHYPALTISKVRQAMVFTPSVVDDMCDQLHKLGLPD